MKKLPATQINTTELNDFIIDRSKSIVLSGYEIGYALSRLQELLPKEDICKYAEEKFGIKKSQYYNLVSVVPLLQVESETNNGRYDVKINGSIFKNGSSDFSPTVLAELVSITNGGKKFKNNKEKIDFINTLLEKNVIALSSTQKEIKDLKGNIKKGLPIFTPKITINGNEQKETNGTKTNNEDKVTENNTEDKVKETETEDKVTKSETENNAKTANIMGIESLFDAITELLIKKEVAIIDKIDITRGTITLNDKVKVTIK